MMKGQTILERIEHDRPTDWDSDGEFLFAYERAALLALKELGTLNEMQYRYAEDGLKKQRRTFVKKEISCSPCGGGEET